MTIVVDIHAVEYHEDVTNPVLREYFGTWLPDEEPPRSPVDVMAGRHIKVRVKQQVAPVPAVNPAKEGYGISLYLSSSPASQYIIE